MLPSPRAYRTARVGGASLRECDAELDATGEQEAHMLPRIPRSERRSDGARWQSAFDGDATLGSPYDKAAFERQVNTAISSWSRNLRRAFPCTTRSGSTDPWSGPSRSLNPFTLARFPICTGTINGEGARRLS